MDNQKIGPFSVIGISVKTTNENGQSGKDIPSLWRKFMSDGILEKIPNRIDDTIYCIYTDYEKDHTRPYTTILGCRVENLDQIPDQMTGKAFEEAQYRKFSAKGNLMQGAVFEEWQKIWSADLRRSFTADFEVYGVKSVNPENAEVDIFIAVE